MYIRPPPVHDPPPASDPAQCRLLGPTALVVQALMGVIVLCSLVLKRHFENPKRPWKQFVMDVGKQLVGQGVVHALNVLISDLVAHHASNNPCSLYFLNVLIDTTIGVGIFYVALKAFTWFLTKPLGLKGFVSGEYGNPPEMRYWWKQLLPYLLSLIAMKLLVLLPLILPRISTALLRFSYAVLGFLSPNAQVVVVMAIFPLIMNVIQFCIVDQIVKAEKPTDYARLSEGQEDQNPIKGTSGSPLTPNTPLRIATPDGYGSTGASPRGGSPARYAVWENLTLPDFARSGAPSPDTIIRDDLSTSRTTDESQREARRSLSPPARRGALDNQDTGLGLTGING
ncbi:Vaculolar membrane protein-domain-containing protein [Naematelia encephala]|uniref:Vaculolar membrane protein-domain-containing protein n=1 Tax=Naematelia encephala TaxID=71784 RepID=A0A1Y2AL09_9TREE|nr:Vaculolar membrane protein-domain-containing protein [Naematelia encephala]